MKEIIAVFVACMFLIPTGIASAQSAGASAPYVEADNPTTSTTTPTTASLLPVKPMKKLTVIGHDQDGFNDDYAYLCSIPASNFVYKGNVVGNPVLFWEPEFNGNDSQLILNGVQSDKYLIEDQMAYSGGKLDQVDLINMPADGKQWIQEETNSSDTWTLKSNSIYDTSAKIAQHSWEYSNIAVVVPVDMNTKFTKTNISGSIPGSVDSKPVEGGQFTGEIAPSPTKPVEHEFKVPENYYFIDATMTWGNPNNPLSQLTERGKDPDFQLYDEKLGQVGASEDWNVETGPSEHLASHIYDSGNWKAVVTYMPTEYKAMSYGSSILNSGETSPEPLIQRPRDPTAKYTIDYKMYPGTVINLPEDCPEGTENFRVVLNWDQSNVAMGMSLLDPNGAEVDYITGTGGGLELTMPKAGIGQYSVAVFRYDDSSTKVDFTLDYSWDEVGKSKFNKEFEAAANGAVIAGLKNAPLLLTPTSGLDPSVENALNLLGVRKVYLVSFDGQYSKVKSDLNDMRSWMQPSLDVTTVKDLKTAASLIRGMSKNDDIVYTTADPWSYWYIGSSGPEGEQSGSIAVGPAALAALHHGAPVILTENHEKTSPAQAWHNYFWKKAYAGRLPPSVGAMVLSARAVDDFNQEMGLKGKDIGSIVTVAGQFDIGASWDRAFVGAYYPGRIYGTPLDEAAWVSRSVFYTSLIFANPAVSSEGVKLWTGSHSTRKAGVLTITEPEKEDTFKYPILQTWTSYQYRFNERGSKYWGCPYTDSVGITPYETKSDDKLDDGICEPYKSGSYWPDMSETDVIPKYCEKAGFSSVYDTQFERFTEDMNRGVLLWLEVMHGGNRDDGIVGTWNSAKKESNPWRGYEENADTLRGATDDPDTVSMSKMAGADVIPGVGPVTNAGIIPETHDGIVIAILQQFGQTGAAGGLDFDKALKNLHSMGMNAGSCLIADTYLHLTLVRHGSVYQVIDPWLTSWYSAFAMEIFVKEIAMGKRVGEAYAGGIHHVGIEYLTGKWWWDIFENVVYYGDPDLVMWSPQHGWDKPVALKAGSVLGGHSPFGARSHPNAISSTFLLEISIYTAIIAAVITTVYVLKKKNKLSFLEGKKKE